MFHEYTLMNIWNAYLSARKFQELLREEGDTADKYDRSLQRRLWRRSFLTQLDVPFDLTERNWRRSLTNFERYIRTKQINRGWAVTLDNKLICH